MKKSTKACAITLETRKRVFKRDKGLCVLCGRRVHESCSNAHFVSRAQLGKGIEENILTLCPECHRKYDGADRNKIKPHLMSYLKSQYSDWNIQNLVYRKGE